MDLLTIKRFNPILIEAIDSEQRKLETSFTHPLSLDTMKAKFL